MSEGTTSPGVPDEPRTFGAEVTKPCGCGPDEPCGAHADRSLPPLSEPSADATGPAEAIGRLVHEVRLAENAKRERSFHLPPWEERSEEQRELDMRIGVAVAGDALAEIGDRKRQATENWERAVAAEAKLAALRTVLLEGGQSDTTVRRRALAIIVAEEPS